MSESQFLSLITHRLSRLLEVRAAVRGRAGCATRPQTCIDKDGRSRAVAQVKSEARGRSRTDAERLCRPPPCRLATRACVCGSVPAPDFARVCRRRLTLGVLRLVEARAKREKGVEPSRRVWKTRMLPATSLPLMERAVQDSNPQPRRPKRRALIPLS